MSARQWRGLLHEQHLDLARSFVGDEEGEVGAACEVVCGPGQLMSASGLSAVDQRFHVPATNVADGKRDVRGTRQREFNGRGRVERIGVVLLQRETLRCRIELPLRYGHATERSQRITPFVDVITGDVEHVAVLIETVLIGHAYAREHVAATIVSRDYGARVAVIGPENQTTILIFSVIAGVFRFDGVSGKDALRIVHQFVFQNLITRTDGINSPIASFHRVSLRRITISFQADTGPNRHKGRADDVVAGGGVVVTDEGDTVVSTHTLDVGVSRPVPVALHEDPGKLREERPEFAVFHRRVPDVLTVEDGAVTPLTVPDHNVFAVVDVNIVPVVGEAGIFYQDVAVIITANSGGKIGDPKVSDRHVTHSVCQVHECRG